MLGNDQSSTGDVVAAMHRLLPRLIAARPPVLELVVYRSLDSKIGSSLLSIAA